MALPLELPIDGPRISDDHVVLDRVGFVPVTPPSIAATEVPPPSVAEYKLPSMKAPESLMMVTV